MRVQHDTEAQEFSIALPIGKAFLGYTEPDERTLDLLHTVVPPEEQNQEVGSQLVEHVLGYAREHDKEIIPSCPFVRSWLEAHPEYHDLIQHRVA